MDLSGLIGRKVWITCSISGKRVFFTGVIKKANPSQVELKDKFDKTVLLDADTIKKAEVEG